MAQQFKYDLHVRSHFDASHTLDWHDKCSALHGHTYHVEITVGANQLNENDIVVDLSILKYALNGILPDHRHLNDWITNPTVERVAEYIGVLVQNKLIDLGYMHNQSQVAKVTVWETPTGGVTVHGPY